jgi:hypothetical protein
MDCDSCKPVLLDLACGELGPEAASAAQAHVEQCPSCRGALDQLTLGLRAGQLLALEQAPPRVSAALLASAEHKARASRAAEHRGGWSLLLELVSRFAMARQVGMLTITALIVVVGLVALPQLTRGPAVPSRRVAEAPAVAATSATPARPAGRGAPEDDQRAEGLSKKDEAQAVAKVASEPGPADAAKQRADKPALALQPAASSGVAERLSAHARASKASRAEGSAPEGAPVANSANSARRTPSQQPAAAMASAEGKQARGFARRPVDDLLDGLSPSASAAPAAGAAIGLGGVQEGLRTRSSTPLAEARALSVQRGCAAASSKYEAIVAAAPSSAEAGDALIALAQCARQRGDAAAARALLERATRIAAVANRARALLQSVQDHPQAAPASTAPPAGEGPPRP